MGSHTSADNQEPDAGFVAVDAIRRVVRALRVSSRAAEKQVGLSAAQLFVLRALAAEPVQSLNGLAARTRTDQCSVSVVVHRLVDRKLIKRLASEKDGRRLELSLTAAGKNLLSKAPDMAQDQIIAAFESMSRPDQEKLASLLSQ